MTMKKARILIVEDEAIIAMEIESRLQGSGHTVTSIVRDEVLITWHLTSQL